MSHDASAAPASTEFCEVRYEALELGTLPSQAKSAAFDINNRGHVTGRYGASAFLWSCEKGLEDIGRSLSRLAANTGVALNDHDQVIVTIATEYPKYLPDVVLWQRNRAPLEIAQPQEFYPASMTNSGMVTFFGSMWSEATGTIPIDIGVSVIYSHLTNLGRLGGVYLDGTTFETRLFTWTRREGVKTLGAPLGEFAYPSDINDRGDLLVNDDSTAMRRPYIMDRNGYSEILPLRADAVSLTATRINLQRQVIGMEITKEMQPHGSFSRAFVWDSKRGFRDLNELFDSPPGNSFEPVSINDWGWIVGNRRDFHASLIVPVPANIPRFQNLNRLKGPQLCRALAEVKVHRLLCSLRE
jgi:hypothetical protein